MLQQITFDIDSLIREADIDAAPAWNGAPLRYHEDYYSPQELDAAFERYKFEYGLFGCIPRSHMWSRDFHMDAAVLTIGGHELHHYSADARCDGDRFGTNEHQHQAGELPNAFMHQVICPTCQWHAIDAHENNVIEAWHDHALPGWRDLPVIPLKQQGDRSQPKGMQKMTKWVEDHYPADWQQDGYPVITEREGIGTRHVPGRSLFGGYDLAHVALAR